MEANLDWSARIELLNEFSKNLELLQKQVAEGTATEAQIQALRDETTAKLNSDDNKFLITFVSQNITPSSFNGVSNTAVDMVTGKEDFTYTIKNFPAVERVYDTQNAEGKTVQTTEDIQTFRIQLGSFDGAPNHPNNKANWITDSKTRLRLQDENSKDILDSRGNRIEFSGTNLLMPNANAENRNTSIYYYVEKGGVEVFYVDTEGNVLQDSKSLINHGATYTPYNTKDVWVEKIETANGVFYYKEIDKKGANELNSSVNYAPNDFRYAEKIDVEIGVVEADKIKELTYVYEKAGSVDIKYVDTDGNELQPSLGDVVDGKPGSPYNTAESKTEKTDTLVAKNGTLFYLAAEGNYTVGVVGENSNLTENKSGKDLGVDPVTGAVVSGEIKHVTYVYQPAGNVVIKYVSTDGEKLKDPYADTTDGKPGEAYTTTDKHLVNGTVVEEKPAVITLEDGRTFELAPANTYPVGTVAADNNLTGDGHAPVSGTVESGKTLEVTYVYQKVANWIPQLPNGDRPNVPYPYDPTNPGRPNDPEKVTYDNTPEEPNNNPPLPYVPGYKPVDPNDGTPLKPVDPNDPKKGYIPPTIKNPNDPGVDTPVPYVPVTPGAYVPYIDDPTNPGRPNDPNKVPYDNTPEEPNNNPPLPYVPGYYPVDPKDGTPLKPVDPNDPKKGYIPPTIKNPNDPGVDTPVPYKPVKPTSPKGGDKPQTPPTRGNKPGTPQKQLPKTGDSSAALSALGMAMLGTSLYIPRRLRRKQK